MPLVTSSHSRVLGNLPFSFPFGATPLANGPLIPGRAALALGGDTLGCGGDVTFGFGGRALEEGDDAFPLKGGGFRLGEGTLEFGDGALEFGDTALQFGEAALESTGVVLVVRCGGTGGGRVKVSIGLVRMRGWGFLSSSEVATAT